MNNQIYTLIGGRGQELLVHDQKKASGESVIDGDKLRFWNLGEYYRYHLDMSIVPQKAPLMQDSVGGGNL